MAHAHNVDGVDSLSPNIVMSHTFVLLTDLFLTSGTCIGSAALL